MANGLTQNLKTLIEEINRLPDLKDFSGSTLVSHARRVQELTHSLESWEAAIAKAKTILAEEKARVSDEVKRQQKALQEAGALLAGEQPPEARAWNTVVRTLPVTPAPAPAAAVVNPNKSVLHGITVMLISRPEDCVKYLGYLCYNEEQKCFWMSVSGRIRRLVMPRYLRTNERPHKLLNYNHSVRDPDPEKTPFYVDYRDYPNAVDYRKYYETARIMPISVTSSEDQYGFPVGDERTMVNDLALANDAALARQADWGFSQFLISLITEAELAHRQAAK